MKITVIVYAIIVILTLLPSPSSQLKQFTYKDPQAGLDLLDEDKSYDGTIILRFGNPMKQVNGSTTCWDNTIYLRIIYPNASISFLSISNHGIPDFNFCLANGTIFSYTTMWGFDQGLLLTFYNSSNVTTSAIMGLFITFEGAVLSTTKLHDNLIDYGGITSYWLVVPNSSSRDGFLFYCRGATVISWIHFNTPNENGEIIERARSGIFQTNIKLVTTSAFYMLEKGFAIAYGGDDSATNLNNSIVDINIGTTNVAYVIFYYFEPDTRTGPFLLYQIPTGILKSNNTQTVIQTLTLQGIICSVDFSGAGDICLLLLNSRLNKTDSKNNTTSQPIQLIFSKIAFLSSGSVTQIGDMKNGTSYGYTIQPLQFGGYLMLAYKDNNIFGYILDNNGDLYGNWSLPQPLNNPLYKSTYVLLANNSVVFVENQNNSIWSVTCDDLFKFNGQVLTTISINKDNKFNNPIITSTNPTLGSQVNESTKQLYISFTYPVTLSSSNISIYQHINGTNHDLLRQRFQGDLPNQFCQIDPNDNKTVIINVFPSTFNEPNSLYYVAIENNFVKRSDTNEALLGIDKNLWTLVTGQITGIIRLTSDGSSYYLSLSSFDQQKFNEQMATDLSYIIPVEDNRLTPINGFEKDISTGTLLILLFFNIKDTSDLSKKSASNISQDFNTLLKYKEYSALMNYNTTSLIDERYPMTIAPLFLRDYLVLIIIIIIVLIILIISYFLASRKFKEADNFTIFKSIIIAADLGLRVSFVVNDARKVPELWLPSLVVLIFSISINIIASFLIIIYEIGKNPKFSKWFSEYGFILPFFTIIPAGHIETLYVLSSKFGLLKIFSTTFSKTVKNAIFWVGILGLIFGIPQFIIQKPRKTMKMTSTFSPVKAPVISPVISPESNPSPCPPFCSHNNATSQD
ncbi:11173_t:CDS:10 [Dentiscutata erythropus]|uniref:11173_t:CDS:1 n=1 Tax=Dentiscutata erythropus TaxID=1348616 RepID=A0A9N9FLQ3_9GLOM|nr:11173_t:CDS:10 [Dentiscutata erythropus]